MIEIIRSRGRDNLSLTGTDYDADLDIAFRADETDVLGGLTASEVNLLEGPLEVRVYYDTLHEDPSSDHGDYVTVRVYGPENGDVVTVDSQEFELSTLTEPSVHAIFENLPIGPKVVRAYQSSGSTSDKEAPITASARSTARRVVVNRNTTPLDLVLQPTTP